MLYFTGRNQVCFKTQPDKKKFLKSLNFLTNLIQLIKLKLNFLPKILLIVSTTHII